MRKLLLLTIAATALAVPAAAHASSTFSIAGWEINPSPATFLGSVAGGGSWYAQVPHTPLSNDPSSPAHICTATDPAPCGAFALAYGSERFTGAFTGGTITFAGRVSTGDGCPDETYQVEGYLTGGGTFDVLLRHFRKFRFLGCPIVAASVVGQAAL